MKIEKIEIKNLASLEGEQEIDFTQEPLKSAGLFAITGKTGAGKSTLLDAICIALYNTAPRFEDAENPKDIITTITKDSKKLTNSDPRNILRRGAKDGYSKVTFSLSNGTRYVAEWSVRLTRNNTFDKVVRTLKQLSPKHEVWDGNTNVQTCIQGITGLDYKQFVSTVILAQNSFANFLSAKQKEKSRLLEKLTGTEIYGKISQMIYQRTSEAEKEYEKIVSQLDGIRESCLSDDDLKQTEESLRLEKSRKSGDEASLVTVEKYLEWYELYRQAKALLEERQKIQLDAQREYNALYDQKQQLERYDKVLPFQSLYNKTVEKQESIDQLRDDISRLQTELRGLKTALADFEKTYQQAKEQLSSVEEEYRNKTPLINRAHTLQGEIKTHQETLKQKQEELEKLQEVITDVQSSLNAKQKHADARSKELQQLKYELQTIAMHHTMVEKVDEVKGSIRKIHELHQDSLRCAKELDAISKEVQKDKVRSEELTTQKNQLLAQTQTLQGELAIHFQANQGMSSAELQERIIHLSDLNRDAQSAKELWTSIANNYEEQENLNSEIRIITADIRKIEEELPKYALISEEKKKQFETANEAYQLSQNKTILDMRKQLKEGSPCPVCGGTHHPYHAQALGDLLDHLSQDYEAAKSESEIAQKELDELILSKSRKEVLLEQKQSSLENVKRQNASYISQWERYKYLDKSFQETSSSVNRTNRTMLLTHLLDSSTRDLDDEKKRNEEYNRHQKEINELNSKIQKLNSEINEVNKDFTDLNANKSVHESLSQGYESTRKDNDNRVGILMSQLEDTITIPLWKDKLKSQYESFVQEITEIANKWNNNNTQISEQENVIYRLETDIESLKGQFSAANKQQADCLGTIKVLNEKIKAAQEEINIAFNGQTVESVEEAFLEAKTTAKENEEKAHADYNKAKKDVDDIQSRITSLQDVQTRTEQELHEKSSELDIEISRFNSDNSPLQYFELKKIFSDPRDWNALREEINRKHEALEKANYDKQRADDKILGLINSEYHPSEDPNVSETSLIGQRGVLQNNIENLTQSIQKLQFTLSKHQDGLDKLEAYEPQRKDLEDKLSTWHKLNNIIGSADGNKFREIAQRYTFSVLVSYTNAQLRLLTSRYVLQAKTNSLSLEIIDHDMFDEVRNVNSLSGGETFIISLGLALGLASLQSGQLSITSLFIDEGFGNLDDENLNIVIDALSRLQSSQGRKIGVISHTEQVKSRISPKINVKKSSGGRSKIVIE